MKTDSREEWLEYRREISRKGGHPFVLESNAQICEPNWMDDSHPNHEDQHLLPHKSQIRNAVSVELHSELALVLATYEQSPNRTPRGAENPEWYHRLTCEIYHRIRANQGQTG